ncbi:MAG: outer membrane protein transport protein [Spirochaetes bacterium]|nr:outer membrane protein transport protein [Spirochaetota bacterium]
MKRFLTVVLLLILSVGVMANGLSLNSIGTRALGMGGAMVGLADDPTAIYWNPAGLAGQNSSIMVFATDIIPMATYKTPNGTPAAFAIDAETQGTHYIGPNLFGVYNMGDVTLGLGAFVPAGLGAEWDGKDFGTDEMFSKIGVFNISPALGYQVTDQFSLGLAVNIYYAMFEMSQKPGYYEDSDGMGYGATFGLKFKANDQLSFGATVRSATNVTMEGDAERMMMLGTNLTTVKMTFERDVEWPLWFGGGLAYQVNDDWVVTADAQYSSWSSLEELVAKYKFDLGAGEMSMNDTLHLNWDSQVQIRLGTAYDVNDNFTLRGGYYYDPAPSPDETLIHLFPSSTNHVITAGGSYAMDNFTLDFALEYLMGGERDIEAAPGNEMPGIHQMDIFAFSIGFGYVLP